jgi:hypothetical protein
MMYGKQLKVGKTERYTFGLSAWLGGDTLTSATVTPCGAGVTIGGTTTTGGEVGFLVTGVSGGIISLIIDYATATRSDSTVVQLMVIAADACPV